MCVLKANLWHRQFLEAHLLQCEALLGSSLAEVHVPAAVNMAILFDMWREAMDLDRQNETLVFWNWTFLI